MLSTIERLEAENASWKTLIGQDGFLFLINDSHAELRHHCCGQRAIHWVPRDVENFLFVLFPDKSLICSDSLPEGLKCLHRPVADFLVSTGIPFLDLAPTLHKLQQSCVPFYRTDTHLTLIAGHACAEAISRFAGWQQVPALDFFRMQQRPYLGDLVAAVNDGGRHSLPAETGWFPTLDEKDRFQYSLFSPEGNVLEQGLSTFPELAVEQRHQVVVHIRDTQSTQGSSVLVFHDSFFHSVIPFLKHSVAEMFLYWGNFSSTMVDWVSPSQVMEASVERFALTGWGF